MSAKSTQAHRVAVIGGDGIGPEVTTEALKVVKAAGIDLETTSFDLGGARYLRDGEVLSDVTLAELRKFDAILLGAVGTPAVPPGVIERGLLLKMRFELDLYINQRPFAGVAPGHTQSHDFVVIRENTEGPYVGEGGVLRKGTPFEVATQGSVNTAHGVERCIRYAFELAAQRERKHLTLVHKTNVLTFAGDLWQRTFNTVAEEFPQVGTAYNHVDAACIYFVHDRPWWGSEWRNWRCFFGQSEPEAHGTIHVRAGTRLSARHRWHGQGKPGCRYFVGSPHAGVPGRTRGGSQVACGLR
jgi:3-isopropylmalate dehydrogenase